MKVAATIFVALALAPTTEAAVDRARYLMGTVCEVAVPTEADAGKAFAEAERIESLLSNFREDSELSRVNRGETSPGPELRALLDIAMAWRSRTDRAFDPFSRAGVKAVNAPLQVDPGAFGKGYALDRMLALIGGDAMLNFGGQILVRGSVVASIADPRHRDTPVVRFTLANASLSTSSNGERLHVIDPRTGRPAPAHGSASVIADDALTADILSTALLVMGVDDGLRWANAHGVSVIYIDESNHIRLSAPARERVRDLLVLDRNFKQKD